MECTCTACMDLLAECGQDRFEHYRRKLLIRGWAGQVSPIERAYIRQHRSEAQKTAAAQSGLRLAAFRNTGISSETLSTDRKNVRGAV